MAIVLGRDMVETIAEDNLLGTDSGIIPCDLLKGFFAQLDVGSFAFYQDLGEGFLGNQQVDSLGSTIDFHLFFGDKSRGAVFFLSDEEMYPVLAHPFLGGKQEPRLADYIINKKLIFVSFNLEIKFCLEIKHRKLHTIMKELESLVKNIKNKEILPIYFLHGAEPYFIDQLVKVIEDEVLSEDERDFNQTVVYGKDTSYPEVLSLARQFPMMGERQVIIVKEAQDLRLTETETEALIQYAQNPIPSTVLVFAHKNKKLDGKKKKLNAALKPYLFLSEEVRDYELPKLIQQELQKMGIKTAPNISNLLAEYMGNDLSRIFNELNKVKIILKDGEVLDEKLVERYIGISKEYNVFELQNAIALKDVTKAFKIAYFMGKNEKENPIISIVSVLFSFFSKVIIYHTLADKSKASVATALGINPFFVKDYQASAGLYPLKYATRIITLLREIDMKSKGLGANQTSDGELLKELVYKIINIDKIKVKV